jgi:scyllo-inositol 2-dehydrogenase (NADP+)
VLRWESRFERWRPVVGSGWRERSDPAEGGGLLYDLGSHLIDQALHLFGPVADVYAEVDSSRRGAEVDDDVFVALSHRDGVRSHLWMSSVAAEPGPRLRLLGDRGSYVSFGLDRQADALSAGARPGDPGWGEVPAGRWGHLTTSDGRQPVPSEPGAYEAFYAGVEAMVRDGSPPPVDPLDAVRALAVIAAAQRSSAERSVVALPASV